MTANSFCAPCSPYPTAPALCFFCGESEVVELFEIWGHEFMWETCCESLHESLCQPVADDPPWGRELLRRIGVEAFTGHHLRRLTDDGVGGLVLDWQLQARPIAFKAACAFVQAHHAHCGPPVTARFSLSAWNGATLVGVAMTGNPVARAFMGRGIVEVNRLCVRRDATCRRRCVGMRRRYSMAAPPAKRSAGALSASSPTRGLTKPESVFTPPAGCRKRGYAAGHGTTHGEAAATPTP